MKETVEQDIDCHSIENYEEKTQMAFQKLGKVNYIRELIKVLKKKDMKKRREGRL